MKTNLKRQEFNTSSVDLKCTKKSRIKEKFITKEIFFFVKLILSFIECIQKKYDYRIWAC